MEPNAIKVSLLGLDDRSQQALVLAFRHRADGRCVVCEEQDAQVVVADFDNEAIDEAYRALRERRPAVPVIAVSTQAPDLEEVAHLQKPVAATQLVELITTLSQEAKETPMAKGITSDKVEQAMKAINARRAAASLEGRVGKARNERSDLKRSLAAKGDEMYFDPQRFLLGRVQEAFTAARESGAPVALTCLGSETIAFDPASDTVVISLSDTQIRSVAIAPTDDELAPFPIEVRPLEGTLESVAAEGKRRTFTAEAFLWNLGYLTSRGRMPSGTSGGEHVYLRRWPNLTRVVVPPNTMRIVSYWVRQPCELMRIYEVLHVPMEDVFAVYTAAHAAGLAGPAKRNADNLFDAFDIPASPRRGLFSAILNRLGKRTEQGQEVA